MEGVLGWMEGGMERKKKGGREGRKEGRKEGRRKKSGGSHSEGAQDLTYYMYDCVPLQLQSKTLAPVHKDVLPLGAN